MSYECKLVFDDTTSTSEVMKEIEGSGVCVRVQQPGDLYLEDQSLNSRANYDARLIYESGVKSTLPPLKLRMSKHGRPQLRNGKEKSFYREGCCK
ncbi:hypothetical protein [Pseudomonas sp. SDO52101_S400]